MALNDDLVAIYSQHQIYLQKVAAKYGNDAVPHLERIQSGVNDIFEHYRGMNLTPKREERIKAQINELTRLELQDYIKNLKSDTKGVGEYEAQFAARTLDDIIESDDFNSVVPTATQVNTLAIASPIKLGENNFITYNTMMRNYWQKWTDEIDAIVQQGFLSGGTIQDIQARVMTAMQLEGEVSKTALSRARRSARAVAITGINHYSNQATIAFVDANDDALVGYEFVAVLDSRTSQQCRGFDGRTFKADDPKLAAITPPLHPNCRSRLVYEVADKYKFDDEDLQRSSNFRIDGKLDPKPVKSGQRYYDYMAKLSAKDQDAILGPTLGNAFRKLDNPDKFAKLTVDSLGNPLTITELKKRDNELSRILKQQKG
jgi:SPP1 gp7 family putative phage head morphogenesis protein